MRIVLIAKPGHANTGVGRYCRQLSAALSSLGNEVVIVHPTVPLPRFLIERIRQLIGWDLDAFFQNYPVWISYPDADVYQLTSQNLATLLAFRRPPGKTVITVHDIIPWLVRNDAEQRTYVHRLDAFFDWLALSQLRRADALIVDSRFTEASLWEAGVFGRKPPPPTNNAPSSQQHSSTL